MIKRFLIAMLLLPCITMGAQDISTKEAKQKREQEAIEKAKRMNQLFEEQSGEQGLAVENPKATKQIIRLFYQLEKNRAEQIIRQDIEAMSDQVSLYIGLPAESEFYVAAPQPEEEEQISALVSEMLSNGTMVIPTKTGTDPSQIHYIDEYLYVPIDERIETVWYDVVYKNRFWKSANKGEILPPQYAVYIIAAAQRTYKINKKAKQQTVKLRLFYMDDILMQVWQVQPQTADQYSYYCISDIPVADSIIEAATNANLTPPTEIVDAPGSYNMRSSTNAHPLGKGSSTGNDWSLNNRHLIGSLPKPSLDFRQEGKVVVYITVNNKGHVVSARAGQGTTISDEAIRQSAVKAAMKARFNAVDHPKAAMGTITYYFGLR